MAKAIARRGSLNIGAFLVGVFFLYGFPSICKCVGTICFAFSERREVLAVVQILSRCADYHHWIRTFRHVMARGGIAESGRYRFL